MLWRGRYLNPSVSLREPAPLRTGELSSGLEKLPNAEGEGDRIGLAGERQANDRNGATGSIVV